MGACAILFPGQGAQSVGMGQDLAEASPACRDLFDRANQAMGYDLATLCFEGPEQELTKSSNTQPGIFLVSMACYALLKERRPGLTPAAMAGLSSGEWTALHLAGVLSFDNTLTVLEARGRFMQEACEHRPGGMVSVIGLDAAALAGVCSESGAEQANLNSPQQTVLAGTVEAVERAAALASAAGAKRAIPLKVAGAFHSSLMKEAGVQLAEVLKEIPFEAPRLPVISNVTGELHTDPQTIRTRMVEQVTSSVHWYQGIYCLKKQGIDAYLECGPGKVLTGLVKRIDKEASLVNIHGLKSLETALEQL